MSNAFLIQYSARKGDSTVDFANTIPEMPDVVEFSRVVLLIHGYCVPMLEAQSAYYQIAKALGPGTYDYAIGIHWPGGWVHPAFSIAGMRAKTAGRKFVAPLLSHLAKKGCVVDIETHSLGAAVAIEAVKAVSTVRNLITTAAAVSNDDLDYVSKVERLFVLHSREDSALKWWKRRQVWLRDALGAVGPDRNPIGNIVAADFTEIVGADHSGYRRSAEFFTYWREKISFIVPA